MYKVDWTAINETASDVNVALTRLQTSLHDVNTEGKRLYSQWDSEAQKTYHARQNTWNTAGGDIANALNFFVSALRQNAEHAQGTEHKNTQVVAGGH